MLDDLASLVDKSLLQPVEGTDGEPRYTMLETIREFAAERLEASGESETIRTRHARYFLAFAERSRAHLRGPESVRWLRRTDDEHDNLRTAMDWGAAYADEPIVHGDDDGLTGIDLAARIAAAISWYWAIRSRLRQARELTRRLLRRAPPGTPAQARLLAASAIVAGFMGNLPEGRQFGEQSLEVWRALGDRYQIAMALGRLANIEAYIGDPRRAGALLDELEATSDDPRISDNLEHPLILLRAQAAKQAADYDAAVPLLERGLAFAYADDDPHTIQAMLRPLGIIAGQRGDHVMAVRLLAEAARVGASLGDRPCTQGAVAFAAMEAVEIGLPERATPLLGLLTRLWEEAGHRGTGIPGAEAAIERCRELLGHAGFDAAWAEGHAMSWDEGVAHAVRLEEDLPGGPLDDATAVRPSGRATSARAHAASPLTPREAEVARLLARGLSNKQIAADLVISERTVHAHVYRILGKLGFSSRSQVAAWAAANRLGD